MKAYAVSFLLLPAFPLFRVASPTSIFRFISSVINSVSAHFVTSLRSISACLETIYLEPLRQKGG